MRIHYATSENFVQPRLLSTNFHEVKVHIAYRSGLMGRPITLLLTVVCGVSVSNIYFPQALTPLVVADLDISPGAAASMLMVTQVGYAVGLFFLLPLADQVPNRRLISTLLALTVLGLFSAFVAPTFPFLLVSSLLVGVVTVVGPIIGVMAANLASDERRGTVTGTLLSGSIGGMLLSRTFGGTLGELFGWRTPYLVAAVLVLLIAVITGLSAPTTSPVSQQRYPALLSESLRLMKEEPDLRRSCLYQATIFGGFHAAGTGVAFQLTGPTYGYGAQAVGFLALVGAATMFCTPIAGRYTDRDGPDAVNTICMLGTIISSAVLLLGVTGGLVGLIALVVGTLVLDITMQCGMVANLARVFALRPQARGRLNTAYMTCAFLGGSVGSSLGGIAYGQFGWPAVCFIVAVLAGIAMIRHLAHIRSTGRRQKVARAEA